MGERSRPYATKAQIERVVAAAREAGIIGGLEVTPDGTIRIVPIQQSTATTAFDRWQDRRQNRG